MRTEDLQRQFLRAVVNGELIAVRQLVAEGADVNRPSIDQDGETPLIRAIVAEQLPIIELLLELGADASRPQQGGRRWTPLMFAHQSPSVIELLVARGADPCARVAPEDPSRHKASLLRSRGETALHLAAAANCAAAVRALLACGVNPECHDDDGAGPLDYALKLGAASEAALALIEGGAELTGARIDAAHASAFDPERDLAALQLAGGQDAEAPGAQCGRESTGRAEPAVRQCPFALEFRHRCRLPVWAYLVLGLLIALFAALLLSACGVAPLSSSFMPWFIAWGVFSAWMAWRKAAPYCPRCHRNIELCRAIYCHVCGKALRHQRCGNCGVYQSWTVVFHPSGRHPGNRTAIAYCPNCGAWLDTNLHRSLGGGRP